jgi:hypothetical protein
VNLSGSVAKENPSIRFLAVLAVLAVLDEVD